jgi:nickel/cobalt transporter (NiCoT) family protein
LEASNARWRCACSIDAPAHGKAKAALIGGLLVLANIAVGTWAFAIFRNYPLLLGPASLAYTLGLRHAVDPDHIAAIDNVTPRDSGNSAA